MSETSATPIINAAAVADVRFGFRLAFSSAKCPVTPRNRSIGHPSTALDRPREGGAEHRHAEEHDQHSEPEQDQRAVAEQADSHEAAAEPDDQHSDDDALPGTARLIGPDSLQRRDRWDPRRADRGCDRSHDRDAQTHDKRPDQRARRDRGLARGDVETEGRERGFERGREEHTRAEPDHRRDNTDQRGLEEHRPHDLTALGTDRPQQGHLAACVGPR